MTFTGLILAIVITVLLVILIVVKFVWPRHQDGRLYSIDEAEEMISNYPSSGHEKSTGQWMLTALVLFVALLAIVLSLHRDDPSDWKDNHGGD